MAQRTRRSDHPNFMPGLVRDERGASLIEFGLFFPILALLVLGTIDLGRGLATKFALDQATQRTIELANLGGRPLADYSHLRAEAATASGLPVTQVTLDQWLECRTGAGASTRAASFTGVCAAGQQSARYVTITIWKDYVPMFAKIPYLGQRLGAGANGSIRLTSDSGVRVQ
ncbi:MAG TPA: TadE/TadG family type IV pilus assembly protein [Allosphingosinicella sp.]|jgi:Flp pilus assembly protein TadG